VHFGWEKNAELIHLCHYLCASTRCCEKGWGFFFLRSWLKNVDTMTRGKGSRSDRASRWWSWGSNSEGAFLVYRGCNAPCAMKASNVFGAVRREHNDALTVDSWTWNYPWTSHLFLVLCNIVKYKRRERNDDKKIS